MSTATQVDEGISLESQRAKIEGWCEVNDVELKGIYEDAGLSGNVLITDLRYRRPSIQ